MFLNNKYTKWYYNIIENSKKKNKDGYLEKHHIIPKSLNGNNAPENLVLLTAREHFVCHYLLTKMVEGPNKKKMFNALLKMSQSKHTQDRYKINSRQFEYLRKGLSENNKGKNNNMYGKTHSDDVKKLLSRIHKGKKISDNQIKRIKESNTGENNFFYGKKHTEETRTIMRAAWQNREELECPHCGVKSKNKGNMTRWHFSNCKSF